MPKLSEQTNQEYEAYKTRALFYGATPRTLQGLVGSVMRKEPVVEVPKALEDHLTDVTLTGISFAAFAKTTLEEVLKTGRYGVLVDAPRYITVYAGTAVRRDSDHPPPVKDRNTDRSWTSMPVSDAVEVVVPATGATLYVFGGPTPLDAVRRYNLFSGGGVLPPLVLPLLIELSVTSFPMLLARLLVVFISASCSAGQWDLPDRGWR